MKDERRKTRDENGGRKMDIERAKQVMESKGVIDVRYNGIPVWIESIRSDNAEVKFLDTDKRMDVPVDKLVEQLKSI
jgi:small acid-soluble spore protein H (minor)